MAVVRWTNLICGALLVLAALGFLTFLPDSVANYSREPEDLWLSGLWIGLLGLLAGLCFVNAWRSNGRPRVGWRLLANLVAVFGLATLFILGRDDPTVPPLLALAALGPVVALVGAWRQSQVQGP
jgi:peptidoglycan/LPS O-acetylase OafA/YrhL